MVGSFLLFKKKQAFREGYRILDFVISFLMQESGTPDFLRNIKQRKEGERRDRETGKRKQGERE